MQVSECEDEAAVDKENRQFDFDCEGESYNHRNRSREYEKDFGKAHALLWGLCQLTLREKIDSLTGFQGMIRSNPIGLLIAIKKHALDHDDFRFWMSVTPDARRACFNCNQRDNESSLEYTIRFRRLRKIFIRVSEVQHWCLKLQKKVMRHAPKLNMAMREDFACFLDYVKQQKSMRN